MLDALTKFYQERGTEHVWWQCVVIAVGGALLISPAVEGSILSSIAGTIRLMGWAGLMFAPTFLWFVYWVKSRKLRDSYSRVTR